jgi:hypothetical protein
MAAGAAVGHVVAACAQGSVHDAFDARAVEGDKGGRSDGLAVGRAEQVSDATKIAGTLLTHGRGQQERSPHLHLRPDEGLADRDECGKAARVVGNAGALESWAAARYRHVQLWTEHGI